MKKEDIQLNILPSPEMINSLVQRELIPLRKKYMLAALRSFCLSCQHCNYCPKKSEDPKCQKFSSFLEQYQKLIIDEII